MNGLHDFWPCYDLDWHEEFQVVERCNYWVEGVEYSDSQKTVHDDFVIAGTEVERWGEWMYTLRGMWPADSKLGTHDRHPLEGQSRCGSG